MSLHFFVIPVLDSDATAANLNAFCAQHRVVSLDRRFVDAGPDSFWVVCVHVVPGNGPLPDDVKAGARRGTRKDVDYREVLPPQEFAVYAQLRAWRKEVARSEGHPLYAVFSNEQMVEIVRRRVATLAALRDVPGIGDGRVPRYGERILKLLAEAWPASVAEEKVDQPNESDPG